MRRHLATAVLTVAVAMLFLIGLIVVGRQFRGMLTNDPRYQFPIRDIACSTPPNKHRSEFLREVQYVGELPDEVPLFEANLPARLTDAFARHPWVEKVEDVSVGPGRRIHVELVFRTPVLAVRLNDEWRAVDAAGVLLPREAAAAGLPRLTEDVSPARGAGQPWGHPSVAAAAKLAGFLHADRKKVAVASMQKVANAWRLTLDGGATVIWGNPPGEEAMDEAPAEKKRHFLLTNPANAAALDLRNVH